jgi:hypothetical protein
MKPFTVVTRKKIDDDNFTSSTVAEDDYAEWSSASVAYTIGDRVIVIADHQVYQAASTHTSSGSNGPSATVDTAEWLIVGATNRWKMFDDIGNTSTTSGTSMEFVVTGDFVDSMGFLGLSAESVRIQASYDATNYYDKTYALVDQANIANWLEYFTLPSEIQTQLIVFDIPPVSASTYTITITGVTTTALASFIMGKGQEFGFTEYGAKVGIISYTTKTADQFGNISIVKKPNRRTMDVSVVVDNASFDSVNRKLVALDGELALWVAAENDIEALTIFGFFRDFEQAVAYPTITYARLQIESIV